MMPSLSVDQGRPSRRRNDMPALSSPPKATEPSSSPSTNHLKPDRDLVERTTERRCDPILHARGHERLADGGPQPPVARATEEVPGRGRKEVVGVEEPGAGV